MPLEAVNATFALLQIDWIAWKIPMVDADSNRDESPASFLADGCGGENGRGRNGELKASLAPPRRATRRLLRHDNRLAHGEPAAHLELPIVERIIDLQIINIDL